MSGAADEKVTISEQQSLPGTPQGAELKQAAPEADTAVRQTVAVDDSGPQSGVPTQPGSQAEPSEDDETEAPGVPAEFPPVPVEASGESLPDSADGEGDDEEGEESESADDDEAEDDVDESESGEDDDENSEPEPDEDDDDDDDDEPVVEKFDDPGNPSEGEESTAVVQADEDTAVLVFDNSSGTVIATGPRDTPLNDAGEPNTEPIPGDASSPIGNYDLDFSALPIKNKPFVDASDVLIARTPVEDEEDNGPGIRVSGSYDVIHERGLADVVSSRLNFTGDEDEADQDEDEDDDGDSDGKYDDDDDGLKLSSKLDFAPNVPTRGWSWGANNVGFADPEPDPDAGIDTTFSSLDRVQGGLEDDFLKISFTPANDEGEGDEDDLDDDF